MSRAQSTSLMVNIIAAFQCIYYLQKTNFVFSQSFSRYCLRRKRFIGHCFDPPADKLWW
ncbi:hypothetical protein CJF30_00010313 [Rutstroemia sp. NJR-2017a BBW]|nr:hypothetical protein CJF30_00010313 [Rutstroemia sp. NJR-2017a BBW]